MPLNVSPRDRRLFVAMGIVLALLIIAAAFLTPSQAPQQEIPSSYSAASSGGKAAYLLLQENGYRVERWERSPTDLPEGKGATLILAEPSLSPTDREKRSLQNFIAHGGRVIATGVVAARALPKNAAAENPMGAYVWATYRALSPSAAARAAPQITMAPMASWNGDDTAVALYGDTNGIVAIRYPFGNGEVTWWAAATPLTNAGLSEPGNLEFFLACLGAPRSERILWDEYFYGHQGASAASALMGSQFKWVLAQFALVALAVVMTFSRRSGPVRAPARESRLSPLEFVDTLAGLYQRAEAHTIPVDIYYRRLRYFLSRRLGLPGNAPDDQLARAVRDRWNLDEQELITTLRAAGTARIRSNLASEEALRLVRILHRYTGSLRAHAPRAKERQE